MSIPIARTEHLLPFEQLSPADFERLCLAFLMEKGYKDVRHFGEAGADQGVDFAATDSNGRRWLIQAKRVASLPPRRAVYELQKLLANPPVPLPDGYLLIVSAAVSRRVDEALREYVASEQLELDVRILGRSELDASLRQFPEVVTRFFGAPFATRKRKILDRTEFPRLEIASAAVVVALVLAGLASGYLLPGTSKTNAQLVFYLLAFIGACYYLFLRGVRYTLPSKEKEIEFLEESAEQQDDFFDFLIERTKLAVAREELSMLRAERRANVLFLIGSLLLMVSVLCPIAAAIMYLNAEVVSNNLLSELSKLKNAAGDIPSGIRLTVGKNWHVLASGLAFGFLCLAAARGILIQQTKQSKAFFNLNSRVNHFERLKSVLEIKFRQKGAEAQDEVVDLVVSRLLDTEPAGVGVPAEEEEPEGSALKSEIDGLLKLVKELKG